MNSHDFNTRLINFLNDSPTPFHATASMVSQLKAAGFSELKETAPWHLEKNKSYFVVRNQSSIIAFTTGNENYTEQGFRMVGAHTDSPCLKVKPHADIHHHHCFQLGVETYGGVLLAPWFDRDLSMAGRISWSDGQKVQHTLIDLKQAIATIPSLAIHLDRDQNTKRNINAQTDVPPLLAILPKGASEKAHTEDYTLNSILSDALKSAQPNANADHILDFELFLYDTQPAANIGLHHDFIASARLDNLLSCFTGLEAIIEAKDSPYPTLLVCNDHEEVGSMTAVGAQGPFLKQVLQRIVPDNTHYIQALQHSLMISADNAHALHPNFPEKHDKQHAPVINHGPVIKINANQRYATTSESSAIFRHLCAQENIPVQVFTARCDMGCGSTIGPITAAELGVRTLDVGLPTYGMHSIRELAGTKDATLLAQVLIRFYNTSSNQL